ncbi:MAG: alanine--tRNA ligase [Myxococcales bacterium]|nr:alanine--tRNA ligase [Myxococcales bacterium]
MFSSGSRLVRIADVRRQFLDFFVKNAHTEVVSGPIVPKNDPTLMFTAAGMVPFKDVFTGKEPRGYTRATTAQKCVRAGGKHNDLENVGASHRHHTFFEMMGNFSFGDYFKEEAISLAWRLITEEFGLEPDRLCVTVFAGDSEVPFDQEAEEIWRAIGVSPDRIFRLGRSENYWQMGDTGPQGPCSEIHYLLDPSVEGLMNARCVAESIGWVEIWNLVFMQFSKDHKEGALRPLPKPSIDTGAGLERLTAVLNDKQSNYDTDAFTYLLGELAQRARREYTGSQSDDDVSLRVIVDHARATAFLVSEGVQPSNEGTGYVLRRIMRRAIRHGARLGFDDLFFHQACLDVVTSMEGAYPDLRSNVALIGKVAESEETSFRRTLERGLKLLEQRFGDTHTRPENALPIDFVAELYDTYGFPIDLTRLIAEERGVVVDEAGALEAVHRRQSAEGSQTLGLGKGIDDLWFSLRTEVPSSDFTGFSELTSNGTITALIDDGKAVESVTGPAEVQIILDRTPMYGESGGQVGDKGVMAWGASRGRVLDVQKPLPELVVHRVQMDTGVKVSKGDTISMVVDAQHRSAVRRSHSATHLVHLALKEKLGDHVQQRGSLVDVDRLRFDYSHFEPVGPDVLRSIEQRVNELILRNSPTQVRMGTIELAKEMGATMLFGEKYGDEVRIVRIADDSLELCGGTHVQSSGEIGLFKVTSESSLAAGVRRIEAVVGLGALELVQKNDAAIRNMSSTLKVPMSELTASVEKLQLRIRQLEKKLDETYTKLALGQNQSANDGEVIGGIKVLFHRSDGTPRKSLRNLADKLRDRIVSGVVILSAVEGDKASLLVAVTKDCSSQVDASEALQVGTSAIGGSGGGRATFAQGGGPAGELDRGLKAIHSFLEQQLG